MRPTVHPWNDPMARPDRSSRQHGADYEGDAVTPGCQLTSRKVGSTAGSAIVSWIGQVVLTTVGPDEEYE